MANTYEFIASQTIGAGGTTNINFNSIPSTYTDIILKLSLRSDTSGTSRGLNLTFNNDTGSNYSNKNSYEYSGGVASTTSVGGTSRGVGLIGGSSYSSNIFTSLNFYITNYAGSLAKTVGVEFATVNNSTTQYAGYYCGLWNSSSAISSIQLLGSAGFVQDSTAYLYGIKDS